MTFVPLPQGSSGGNISSGQNEYAHINEETHSFPQKEAG